MFRASPWIVYEPSESRTQGAQSEPNNVPIVTNQDVDMDAPQISTLREEESPSPQPTRTSKFRVKLLVNEAKGGGSSPGSGSRTPAPEQVEDEGEDEDEDEEDQLIDDDDEMVTHPSVPLPRQLDTIQKRRPPHKRRPKKTEKKIAEDERKSQRAQIHIEPHLTHETTSTDVTEAGRRDDHILNVEPLHPKLPLKKKPLPRKVAAAQRSKGKGVAMLTLKDPALSILDDGGNFSETYTGTAASSPVTFYPEATPEADNIPLPITSLAPADDTNLEFVPLPIYPLPSKPFPVQPPPKIGTGFAPVIPLDKGGLKVRRWRLANREIRGIAGGRWFARAWVGDKESEYAAAGTVVPIPSSGKAHVQVDGVALPKLPSVSISAQPSGKGSNKGRTSRSRVVSAAPSRAGSVAADVPNVSNNTRTPTKMRSIISVEDIPT